MLYIYVLFKNEKLLNMSPFLIEKIEVLQGNISNRIHFIYCYDKTHFNNFFKIFM